MDETTPEEHVVRLQRRTQAEQVAWLINQVSFLIARIGALEREVETLKSRQHLTET